MTVKEAFAAAGHPVPDNTTRIVAYIYVNKNEDSEEDNSFSITARNWLYKTKDGYGIFSVVEDGAAWVHTESTELSRFLLVAQFSINLSNLPAIDCINQLPECIANVVPTWVDEVLEVEPKYVGSIPPVAESKDKTKS